MTTISHNLTGKIDEKTVAILSEVDTIARDLKLAFFIVGATARDILLQHAHGIRTTRATLDVDIGVFVSDWEQFRTLKEALVNTGILAIPQVNQSLSSFYQPNLREKVLHFASAEKRHTCSILHHFYNCLIFIHFSVF